MGRNSFRIQVGQRGCYAAIDLDVSFKEMQDEKGLSINYNGDERWKLACEAGIHIFYDYFRKPGRFEVTINDVAWLPVDTSFLIVMYATAEALAKELDYKIPGLKFDKLNEVFIFPEYRAAIEL